MVLALTKSNLKKIPYGSEVGFQRGIRARASKGSSDVVFLLQKRIRGSRSPVKVKLGTYPDNDLDQIESKASTYRSLMNQGIHPYAHEEELIIKKAEARDAEARKKITLSMLLDRFEIDRAVHQKGVKPSTVKDRRQTISNIFSQFLHQPISNITGNNLERIFGDVVKSGRRETAKKSIRYLNSVMNYAVNTLEILPRNPCATFKGRIATTTDTHRIALSVNECQHLLGEIEHLTDSYGIGHYIAQRGLQPYEVTPARQIMFLYIGLLLLTGIRKRELLDLRWENVFLTEKQWKIWNAEGPYFWLKTSKQDQPLGIPITGYMMGAFKILKAKQINGYVFPSPRPANKLEAPLFTERKAYPTLQRYMPENTHRLTAQLFRKTFATTAYGLGLDIRTIELITGHYGKLEQSNVAMDQYIATNVEHHREHFQMINMAMLDAWDWNSDAADEAAKAAEAERQS